MQQSRRPGLGERMSQLGYLLKHTFTIVGRDTDILKPLYRMWLYAAVMVTAFFAAVAAFAMGVGGRGTLLLIAACGMFVYKFFYYNRLELAQSWLVFETASGNDRDLPAAKRRVSELRSQARYLALLDMLAAWIASRRGDSEDGGIGGTLVNLLVAGLTEVWDLANHYLLPAVSVDGLGLGDGVKKLRRLRDSVPETLVGVFGIDVMGRAVGTIMAPVYVVLFVGGLGLGLGLGDALPVAFSAGRLGELYPAELPGWLPVDADTTLNWLPLLVCIWVGKLGGSLFERLVTSVKVIYFTLFYARIEHPSAIDPDIREELEGYLRMEGDADTG